MGESLYLVKFADGVTYAELALTEEAAKRKADCTRHEKEGVWSDIVSVERTSSATTYAPLESISSISLDSLDTSGLYSTGTSWSDTVTIPYDPSRYTTVSLDASGTYVGSATADRISELEEKIKKLEAELAKAPETIEEDPNDSEGSIIGKLIHWVYDDGPLKESGVSKAVEYTPEGYLKLESGDILDLDDLENLSIEIVEPVAKRMKVSRKREKSY